jgi:hypothetical protein
MKYYFNKSLEIPFDEAVSKVTEELKKEGFGILTEIDVKETLKKNSISTLRNIKFSGHVILILHTRLCKKKIRLEPCSPVM